MSSAIESVVRPSGSQPEGLVLAAITVCMAGLLGWYVAVSGRQDSAPELLEWQISAFDTLEGADQAIYNSLFTVKDEIPYIYDDINLFNEPGEKFRWPNFEDFQEWLLPPFYQDTSWVQNGSVEWSLYEPLAEGEMQGSIIYLGTNGRLADQGSFLLIIGHVHAGITNNNSMQIWYNSARSIAMPENSFQDSLIREGWQLVVPYQGDQEVERLFGE